MNEFFEDGGDETAAAALERRMRIAERTERKTRGTVSAVVAGTLAAVLIFGGGVAASALSRKPAAKPTTITVPAKQTKAKAKSKAKAKKKSSTKKSASSSAK